MEGNILKKYHNVGELLDGRVAGEPEDLKLIHVHFTKKVKHY